MLGSGRPAQLTPLHGSVSHIDLHLAQKEVKEDLLKETEGRVKAAVGFRHVIDLLASEQKLVVGHNCFLGTSLTISLRNHMFFSRKLSNVFQLFWCRYCAYIQ